ncbi:hypothetical protein [Streptomyces finlayi]|uniref:hypothetical protein n=1 Tax=Streptomyces finlayi TaxID=67296 RepID=UPI0016757008|nr:hypothetical protein [Streptomyces finlayi]
MSAQARGRRFEKAGLVLGPVGGRAAALCRFAGRTGAVSSPASLAVVEEALGFAERLEGVDDVGEFMELWSASHIWGYTPNPYITRPKLSEANAAVLGHVQKLLEALAPEQLREVALGLSVDHDTVVVALELVEEAAAGDVTFRAQSMTDLQQEMLWNEARVGDEVDVLLLEAPSDWPPMPRAALVLALVWDVADLIGYAAELSTTETLPAPVLWQAAGAEHFCAGVPVPGTDLPVWAKIDAQPYDGRPLFGQAAQGELWRWSLSWQLPDGTPVHYTGGHTPTADIARWRAQRAVQDLLADPYRAKSPTSEDWLIPPP